MATSFAQTAIAALQPFWPGYQLWYVPCARPSPDLYCARRVGEPTSCAVADSPESLVRQLMTLEFEAAR